IRRNKDEKITYETIEGNQADGFSMFDFQDGWCKKMEIGGLLKEAREEKGYTLDNIQEKTKIQKRYLVAIEQGDCNALPGKFDARAFIREQAEAVEIDPEVDLAEFKEEKEIPEEEPVKYTRIDRTDKIKETNKC